ncbi:MAG: MmcQ/YjbR family DNA-binding protein [Spirochaetes bacterium]|jgi:predicted DNA-binding protein (MmcQ/YjbR family)|nr:MmcQ/YjbR family DNA-binding protein [Spirochaetota bacterium]
MQKPGSVEDFPFDNKTLVFKVGSKMFGLISLDKDPLRINLKCDPDRAIILREKTTGIEPGFHMNKRHWNTVTADIVPEKLLFELIDHSYDLVFKSLTKKERLKIEETS